MWKKVKQYICYILILLMLPYVITIFFKGPDAVPSGAVDEQTIKVKNTEEQVTLSFYDYCIGKLAKEIPGSYEMEALKCQAIIVRTTALKKLEESDGESITEETLPELADYEKDLKKYKKAWESTKGKVLMFEEKLAFLPFCRLSNGSTRDGKEALGVEDYPYLKIKECPLDLESREQIQTKVVEQMDAQVTGTDSAGYVTTVQAGGEQVSGEEFRSNYYLPSSCFFLHSYEGTLRITTRGVGHGLGLSQYTANEMAKEGKTAEEILTYFYEGTQIKEVADIVEIDE